MVEFDIDRDLVKFAEENIILRAGAMKHVDFKAKLHLLKLLKEDIDSMIDYLNGYEGFDEIFPDYE